MSIIMSRKQQADKRLLIRLIVHYIIQNRKKQKPELVKSQTSDMKKQRRLQPDHPRMRSHSQDLYDNYSFEQEMKCDQSIEQLSYFTANMDDNEQSCRCPQCQQFVSEMDGKDLDADMKKRIKRRQYKKRQKLKAQQKKQQALADLSAIIADIYQLKTDYQTEQEKIQQCLKAIQKNVNRFYDFINAVIRQQVETIKKQMRICLMQLASPNPTFAKVPRLYEQFMKVNDGSPEVQKIINRFIDIISEKTQQVTRYQRNLDKKTFRYLLKSDQKNQTAFLQVIKIIQQGNIKYQRQKQMLRMIIQLMRQKNIWSSCSSSEHEEDEEYSQGSYQESNQQYENENQGYDEEQRENESGGERKIRRRRKNKGIKHYQVTFEKTFQMLLNLEKTLSVKKDQRLPCNVEQQWLDKIRAKFLKKTAKQPQKSKR